MHPRHQSRLIFLLGLSVLLGLGLLAIVPVQAEVNVITTTINDASKHLEDFAVFKEYQKYHSTANQRRNLASEVAAKPKPTSKGRKIAIIGAGPTGLLLAKALGDKNISVTVFEKDHRAGGIPHTVQVKNKYYDLSTMWVPKGGLWGYGIDPCLQAMISVGKHSTLEDGEYVSSFNSTSVPKNILSILDPFSTQVVIEQLVSQWAFYSCRLLGECGYVNMTNPQLFKTDVMQRLSSFIVDFLTGGSIGVKMRIPFEPDFTPAAVFSVLWRLGVRLNTLPSFTPPSLKSYFMAPMNTSAPYFKFIKGYGNFFEDYAEQIRSKNTKILLSSPVKRIVFHNKTKTWDLFVKRSNTIVVYKGFTQVVAVTGTLDSTVALMNNKSTSPQLKSILAPVGVLDEQTHLQVHLADIKNDTVLPKYPVAVNPSDKYYGEVKIDTSPVGFILRRYANDTRLAVASKTGNLTTKEWYMDARIYMKHQFGVELAKEPLASLFSGFPNPFLRTTAFVNNVTALQNINGFIVAGQGVAGAGVPVLCRHVKSLVNAFF